MTFYIIFSEIFGSLSPKFSVGKASKCDKIYHFITFFRANIKFIISHYITNRQSRVIKKLKIIYTDGFTIVWTYINIRDMSQSTQLNYSECLMPDGSQLRLYKSPKALTGAERLKYLDGKITLTIDQKEWFCMTDLPDPCAVRNKSRMNTSLSYTKLLKQKFSKFMVKFIDNQYYWICPASKLIANQNFMFIMQGSIDIPLGILFGNLSPKKIWEDLIHFFTLKSQLQLIYRNVCHVYGSDVGAKWKSTCKELLFSKINPLPSFDSHPAAVPIYDCCPIILIPDDCLREIMILVINHIYNRRVEKTAIIKPNDCKIIMRYRLICKQFNKAIVVVKCFGCLRQIPREHPRETCDRCLEKQRLNLELKYGWCHRCRDALTFKDIKDSMEEKYCLRCANERDQIRCICGHPLEDDDY